MSVIFSLLFWSRRSFYGRWLLLCCLLTFVFGLAVPVEAQRRIAPRPIPYSELEREEGEQRLREMRQMGIEGVYSFLFEVRVMPRRGEDVRFTGQLWGSRNAAGPVFRYEFRAPEGEKDRVLRFLVQNGFEPEIWRYDSAEEEPRVEQLEESQLFTPITGTNFTPFDLQMPYLFWQDFAYEGLSRVRGRSSHGFLMYPPSDLAAEFPWLEGVRIFLDAEFHALTGAEVLGEEGEPVRSFTILEIKRVVDEWIVKSIDYRDRLTGDKTRLSIRGAVFDLPEEGFSFSPETLDAFLPSVARERFSFF